MVQYWGGSDADEWLITPKLNLVVGKNYKLLFKTGLEMRLLRKVIRI